ncbi:tRNA (guanosine(37)-N1)-methyltransferase TrmD [Candidatus Margulisiibacteriota bacterium]
MLTINVFTIFPERFKDFLEFTFIKKAIELKKVQFNFINIRDFAEDKHRQVDDIPYGGGSGMVMKVDVLYKALTSVTNTDFVYLTPAGKLFDQNMAKDFSTKQSLSFVCGSYEGIDERIYELVPGERVSIGSFVTNSGELPAMTIIESIVRLLSGVLGNEASLDEESFSHGLLEYPHYTRPDDFMGLKVPDVLKSGNHGEIGEWRREQSIALTEEYRRDLLGDDKC